MKFIENYIESILSPFKWYRKKIGGTWYRIELEGETGFAAPSEFWTKNPNQYRDMKIIKTEVWTRQINHFGDRNN